MLQPYFEHLPCPRPKSKWSNVIQTYFMDFTCLSNEITVTGLKSEMNRNKCITFCLAMSVPYDEMSFSQQVEPDFKKSLCKLKQLTAIWQQVESAWVPCMPTCLDIDANQQNNDLILTRD